MNRKLTTALAVLLFAGASGAAMAQDRDHGDRGQSPPQNHVQSAPRPAPQAAPQHAAPPPGGGHFGERGGPQNGGFHGRDGQERALQPPPMAAPQHVNRDAGPGPAPRQFDHGRGGRDQVERQRGPSEVIPPNADRGREIAPGVHGEGRFDGRNGRDNRFDRRDGRDGRDNRFDGRDGRLDGHTPLFGGSRGAPPRWQPGRYPPVMWAHDRFRAGYYRPPYGYYSRAWGFGDFLPRPWFVRDYWLDDFLDFDLPYPPPGFVWVRVGPDALMIDRFTGRIVQVVHGIFW